MTSVPQLIVKTRKDFRDWLEKNHDKENKIAVTINKKHTGIPSPSHRELIEEAICFGWIDTTIKRLDENQFIRNFARRNRNSRWSDNTLNYAGDLIRRGLMTQSGLRFYEEGKARPTHDHGIPKNPERPIELEKELNKKENKLAKENFNKFAPSTKRMLYRWILHGKLKETREKRVKQIVENAKQKRKALRTSGKING